MAFFQRSIARGGESEYVLLSDHLSSLLPCRSSNDERSGAGEREEFPIINCPHSTDCTQERCRSTQLPLRLRGINAFLPSIPNSVFCGNCKRTNDEGSETFPAFRRISFSRKCRLVRPTVRPFDRPTEETETVAAAITTSPSSSSSSR